MSNYDLQALELHLQKQGKLGVVSKVPLNNQEDLSLAYTPGVAAPCREIYASPDKVWDFTIKNNTLAVVSDGSAVLGLGNIGPYAGLPVMEGKAVLFKKFAGIDAWPICLDTQDVDEIIQTVRHIAPVFGGINLEDIAAPRCFEIERRLQDLGIPVFHDDQHGTALVVLAALINACRVLKKEMQSLKVAVVGSGAAGTAIAKLFSKKNRWNNHQYVVEDIYVCDSKGLLSEKRKDLSREKVELLEYTNFSKRSGGIKEAIEAVDVFIGVSKGGLLTSQDIASMNPGAIIFALANPFPEIMPPAALKGGCAIYASGRSDLPNQVNNALVFPGLFRGLLDAKSKRVNPKQMLASARALADSIASPTPEKILPSLRDDSVSKQIAQAVLQASL